MNPDDKGRRIHETARQILVLMLEGDTEPEISLGAMAKAFMFAGTAFGANEEDLLTLARGYYRSFPKSLPEKLRKAIAKMEMIQ